ncbi:YHS domain-containing (seleno)protein [Limibacillus halophilus]|uniref:YHS domain-containing protein n=1 Tax=Limibacillus halophilus TaxID=1579333 RepID=A0A839SXG4_9PROT|nr:YHS domain-containing (seleno)protein [Limibacillus halophilus]MBB3066216.1 YHS domain-containing protein [Limibacillus halophilus]
MSGKLTLSALALIGAIASAPAFAADEHNTVPGLTAAGAPLGLHGVDPVAFIQLGNRIEGTATYTAIHDGVAYYFASEENKETFEDAPEKFVPENGGFCTYGVSVGKKFDGDPKYSAVVDGKLYVFLNEEIFKAFQQDRAGTIAKAEENWAKIQHTAAGDL